MQETAPAASLGKATDAAATQPSSATGRGAPVVDTGERRRPALRPLGMLRPYILRYKIILALGFVALVVSAGTMLVVPTAVRRMIDYGFSSSDGRFIDRYFLMLIGLGVLLSLASSARFYCVNWLGERVVADVRSEVFRHLAALGPSYFERTHSAEVMSRLTADTTQIKAAAGTTLSQALRNLIMLVGALAMMMVTSVQLSLMVLVAIPLIVFPIIAYGKVVRRLSRNAQDTLADASTYAAENLAAVRTMQAFTWERAAATRFSRAVETSFEAARSRLKARAGLTAMVILLVVTSVVGVLWYGASAVVSGQMSGGRLSQFVLYALFAAGALAELSEVWGEVQQAAGAAERLTEILASEPAVRSPSHPMPLPEPARGEIAFHDVGFAYPTRASSEAVSGLSFTVAHGETVALVGPSGAGKSTILNLILRFYDVGRGRIEVDGVDIRDADIYALRSRLSLVPQDVALFADTVAANISYGTERATQSDIEAAARLAQADDFICALPEGYRTRLGERGVTLSGGQRQRIAIARAILRNAPILLLDEATSALDAESEGLVQKALEAVMAGRTTIVIAHRLATIRKADRILVLDGGRIVEEGTHERLVAGGGLYARLAQMHSLAAPGDSPPGSRPSGA